MGRNTWGEHQNALRDTLKALRKEAGLTQEQLAEKVHGLLQEDVSKYENGERQLSYLEVADICKACGVKFSTFSKQFEK